MIPLIETLKINLWLKILIDATMKSFVIFAVAGLLGFILRRRSAAVHGLVWSLALVGCLAVPFFSLTLPQWEVGVLPATPERFQVDWLTDNRQAAISPVPIESRPLPTTTRSSAQATPTSIQPETTTSEIATRQSNTLEIGLASLHWNDWIAVCWAAGTLFLIARLLVGIGAVWHVSTYSDNFNGLISQVSPDWKRAVSIRQSDAVTVPMVWGLFRPVILLPADADEWEPERQRAVLLHELAHIQRQDWLMQTVAQITCAVYWFNPLVWFAARRMRTEVERACDDHVLNAGYQSTDYAQHLLNAVRNIKKVNTATRSVVAMARQSKIEGRLRTVLAENRNRRPITTIAVAIGLLALICLAVPMGVMQLVEALGPEQALYKEIQAAENFQLEPLPETATEQAAQLEQLQQHWDRGLQLCEQFLNTYLESDRYEEVLYKKLTYLYSLRRYVEFEKGIEEFLSEYPDSKYTGSLRKRRAYSLEFQFKYDEALAEWDKIDDPALLIEAYTRKATIYAEIGNSEKAKEFNLLRAELILGKSSPEFLQIIEADKRRMEAGRKQDMYWKDFFASLKSYVAVKADGEIFTGIILSHVGHILVSANVTEAETIHAKIGDYQPAKVVVVDSKSRLAVVQVDGQRELRPIVLGNIDDLEEYAPIPHLYPEVGSTSPTIIGYTYPTINVISTRGYPNAPNLPPEFHQNAFEIPTYRGSSIQELEIDDGGKVAALQAGTPTGKIIGGDAFVYHDGRLLAVAVDNEVRYKFGSAITNPLLIDQIRAALKRMNMIELMENQDKGTAN